MSLGQHPVEQLVLPKHTPKTSSYNVSITPTDHIMHAELAIGVQREPLVDIPLNNDVENTAPSQSNSVRSVVEQPVAEDTPKITKERRIMQSRKSAILMVEKGQAPKRTPANA